ncbi:hypothetical protein M199_gp222 [Halogranum tailed virus 1]|uniref:HIT domain-containing protein n=1 Tax=Halogranum tailed virus 1 TaxID=1273749 RepID=R4T6X2_9CAUD|nr:hypothetical protein M199_gp222 [Halogranum tailed virus 1]AGM11444.1 hypothetical protein HGTV1_147 [Halogranum tailed virus 1]
MPRRNIPGSARMPARENLPNEETQCAFCPKPDKKTRWFHEDDTCLLINKPNGEPMVVLKRHTTEPTDEEREHIKEIVSAICGEHTLREIMAHVPNHYHVHVVEYEQHPEVVFG